MAEVTDERLAELVEQPHFETRDRTAITCALRELQRLREQTRWIPVTERLPEDDELVLVADWHEHTAFRVGRHVRHLQEEARQSGDSSPWPFWRPIGPLPGGEG